MITDSWFPVVPETSSITVYAPYQNESFEHHFIVDYDDERPVQLLRIDIQDRFYLKEFSLIYLETGETIEGNQLGDTFLFRFVWQAKKGKYKIVAKGGKYRYSVFLFESALKLKDEPICQAISPFNILVSWPIKDYALLKQVAYRKVGATDWVTSPPNIRKVPIEVDPTSPYEVKMRLVVGDIFETEYSKSIITTVHQSYGDSFEPDLDFFNTTLCFEISTQTRLKNVSITLGYKPHSAPNGDWIFDAKLPPNIDRKWKAPRAINWDLSDRLYDQLIIEDIPIDWQLIFENITTHQITQSTTKKFILRQRNKIQRGESIPHNIAKFIGSMFVNMYLCRDGQFWYKYKEDCYELGKFVRVNYTNIKGNFILERKNPTDQKCDITLMPKFRPKFETFDLDGLSTALLPELVKLILSCCYTPVPSTKEKLKQLISLNLVCKHWSNLFCQGVLQLHGELLDKYNVRKRGMMSTYPLNIDAWTSFRFAIEDEFSGAF